MSLSNFLSNLLCSLFTVSCLALSPVKVAQTLVATESMPVNKIVATQLTKHNETDFLASEEGIISETDWEGIVDFEEVGNVATSTNSVDKIIVIKPIESFASAPAVYAPKDFAPVDPVGDQYAKWLETAWINKAISTKIADLNTTTIEDVVTNDGLVTSSVESIIPITISTSTATTTLHIVISAISIGTASSTLDEFVEIFNPTSESVSLGGWKLKRVTASGKTENYLVRPFLSNAIIKPGGYFLIAHPSGYSTSTAERVLPDLVYTTASSIAASNTIILFNNFNEVIDLVGFGEVSQFEGTPAQNLENNGQSLVRIDEVDTDNNETDFKLESYQPKSSLDTF